MYGQEVQAIQTDVDTTCVWCLSRIAKDRTFPHTLYAVVDIWQECTSPLPHPLCADCV